MAAVAGWQPVERSGLWRDLHRPRAAPHPPHPASPCALSLPTSGSVRTPRPVRTACRPSRGGVMRGVGVGTSRRSAVGGRAGAEQGATDGWPQRCCSSGATTGSRLLLPPPPLQLPPPARHRGPADAHPRSRRARRCRAPPGSGARPAPPGTARRGGRGWAGGRSSGWGIREGGLITKQQGLIALQARRAQRPAALPRASEHPALVLALAAALPPPLTPAPAPRTRTAGPRSAA